MCIHTQRHNMSTKTISIRDEVYNLLRDAKREGESFSDVIERLLKKDRMDISEYFSVLKDSRVLKELEEDSKKIRELSRLRL